jgi:hypothetical protein
MKDFHTAVNNRIEAAVSKKRIGKNRRKKRKKKEKKKNKRTPHDP